MIRVLSLLLLPMLLLGCSVKLSRPYPEVSHYLIEAERAPSAQQLMAPTTSLLVRSFSISPLYQTEGFVIHQEDGSIEESFYSRHIIPAEKAIRESTRQWLQDSNLFVHVASPHSLLDADYILEGHVADCSIDKRSGDSEASLVIEFTYYNSKANTGVPVSTSRFSQRVAPESDDPGDFIAAWNQALSEILAELEAETKALRSSSVNSSDHSSE